MDHSPLWSTPFYREVSLAIFLSLVLLGLIFWSLKKKFPIFQIAWVSTTSWFIAAPLLLGFLGAGSKWASAFFVLISIFSAKIFLQMVGMYHRSWFVWTTYLFIILQGLLVHTEYQHFYNYIPFVCMGTLCLIPLIRNSPTHMIQYIALATMAFIFFGWSQLHLVRFLHLDQGPLIVLYLIILSEFSEAVSGGISKFFCKINIFSRINPQLSLEGFLSSLGLTILLAWLLRQFLPAESQQFWMVAGVATSCLGRWGNLIMAVIKKDLGIKNRGVFILGRGDLLARVDKYIFVGPMYFWIYQYFLNQNL